MNHIRIIVLVGLIACVVISRTEVETIAQLSDMPPIKNKAHKAMVEIFKHMNAVDKYGNEVSSAILAKHCGAINKQFELINEKDVPQEIRAEFANSKLKFGEFYKQFLEVTDKQVDEILEHAEDSAQAFGQSFEALMEKAKGAGFDVKDYATDIAVDAKSKSTNITLSTIATACKMYLLDVGRNPNDIDDLLNKPADDEVGQKWRGPYLDAEKGGPVDAWGTKITMEFNMETNRMEIVSAGPDKKFGTDDDLKQ